MHKIAVCSALAMLTAFILPNLVIAGCLLMISGHTDNLLPFIIWVGIFAFMAWVIFVVPFLFFTRNLLSFSKYWISISASILLAAGSYLFLCGLAFRGAGRDLVILLWYPALMGLIFGVTYTFLLRRNIAASDEKA